METAVWKQINRTFGSESRSLFGFSSQDGDAMGLGGGRGGPEMLLER